MNRIIKFSTGSYFNRGCTIQVEFIPSVTYFSYWYDQIDNCGGEKDYCMIFSWLCWYFEIRITNKEEQ